MKDAIRRRLEQVRERMARAAERSGRAADAVRLVAVSKKQPLEAIRIAHQLGCQELGESYSQELVAKAEALSDVADLRWHHIGHLQTNKVRPLLGRVAMLHGVDREKLLDEIERRAAHEGTTATVLIQVNLAGEKQKGGSAPDALETLLERAASCAWVRVAGLMTLPPACPDPEGSRPFFRRLCQLRERHGGAQRLPELSMGMSGDFEVAIEEGSTMVRIGTAIFGER